MYVLELMWGHYYPAYLKICKRRTRNDHCIYDKHWHGATHFELNENDCALSDGGANIDVRRQRQEANQAAFVWQSEPASESDT